MSRIAEVKGESSEGGLECSAREGSFFDSLEVEEKRLSWAEFGGGEEVRLLKER